LDTNCRAEAHAQRVDRQPPLGSPALPLSYSLRGKDQLRHSAIKHLVEADVRLALLMVKSRHSSLISLQRCARPCPESVVTPTVEHHATRRQP